MSKKRGVALIFSFIVIIILAILAGAIFLRSISESRIAQKYLESTQAFWLAEAGVNQALKGLRTNYALANISDTALGPGGYSATIVANPDGSRTVTARGFVPFVAPLAAPIRAERILEVGMNKSIPPNFYDNAIYSAGDIVLKGNSFDVNGNVRFAGTISGRTDRIAGTFTNDLSINPLAHLDYAQLRAISQSQGNYHSPQQLGGPFPTSFWYNEASGIPNVVFLEGSLDLSGNDRVGGFFVVGGEVTYDATIRGNVSVDGCIYTRGNFTVKGGGNSLNVNGGVWSGGTSTLDGNPKISYNATYMSAIQTLGINASVQITSWRDTQNPYILVP